MAQLIHHSYDLKKLYHECVAECEGAVTTKFGNLRSAKHRIESEVTPLSRSILNISGLILFACKLAVIRKGEREGIAAETLLSTLCVEVLLLLAMMADAGSEALALIRMMDREGLVVIELVKEAIAFLDRITYLFHHDGVLQTESHTAYIIDWLSKPTFYVVGGVGRCIGGEPPSKATIDSAFAHMRKWTVMADAVLKAEIPDFSLLAAFMVFSLSKTQHPMHLTNVDVQQVQRLAKTFNKPNFSAQFQDLRSYAQLAYFKSGFRLDPYDCWRQAIDITRNSPNHPSGDLWYVLKRSRVYAPSTSGVEQSFSLVAMRLPEQRLNAQAGAEEQAVRLIMSKVRNADDPFYDRARAIWGKAFPAREVRNHTKRRIDEGRAHNLPDSRSSTSEKAFLCRYHSSVVDQTPTGCSSELSDHRISLDASHEAEISFNAEKRQKKLVEASVHHRTPTGTPVRRCPIASTLAAASLPPPANPQSHIKYQSSCWGSRQDCLGSSQKPTWRPPRRSWQPPRLAWQPPRLSWRLPRPPWLPAFP